MPPSLLSVVFSPLICFFYVFNLHYCFYVDLSPRLYIFVGRYVSRPSSLFIFFFCFFRVYVVFFVGFGFVFLIFVSYLFSVTLLSYLVHYIFSFGLFFLSRFGWLSAFRSSQGIFFRYIRQRREAALKPEGSLEGTEDKDYIAYLDALAVIASRYGIRLNLREQDRDAKKERKGKGEKKGKKGSSPAVRVKRHRSRQPVSNSTGVSLADFGGDEGSSAVEWRTDDGDGEMTRKTVEFERETEGEREREEGKGGDNDVVDAFKERVGGDSGGVEVDDSTESSESERLASESETETESETDDEFDFDRILSGLQRAAKSLLMAPRVVLPKKRHNRWSTNA